MPQIETEAAPSEVIHLGFIGTGGRGTALLKSVLQTSGAIVRAVADSDSGNAERASRLVEAAGQPKPEIYSDWNALLRNGHVDALVSALPCDLHHACYLDVIAAAKDLYAEKPLCLSVTECNAIVEAANSSNQIVQVGFQRRADPRFLETMRLLRAGELGALVEGRIAWSNSWGPLYGWFGHRERSGDWMIEQAVHNWDVMNWANQSLPVRAMGLGKSDLYREKEADRNVTDYYSALVEYGNGVIVNILHSWVAPGQEGKSLKAFNDEYTRLIGTRAGIDFNSGTISYRRELNLPDKQAFDASSPIDNTLLSIEAFLRSVRHRTPPVSSVEQGRDAALACLLVREAVYRGGTVTMEELQAAG